MMATHPMRLAIEQRVRLTNAEWEAFEALLQFRRLKRKELFLREGQVCRQLGFIA